MSDEEEATKDDMELREVELPISWRAIVGMILGSDADNSTIFKAVADRVRIELEDPMRSRWLEITHALDGLTVDEGLAFLGGALGTLVNIADAAPSESWVHGRPETRLAVFQELTTQLVHAAYGEAFANAVFSSDHMAELFEMSEDERVEAVARAFTKAAGEMVMSPPIFLALVRRLFGSAIAAYTEDPNGRRALFLVETAKVAAHLVSANERDEQRRKAN